ncbi:hypothetical protein KUV50_06570 [Membranicola marinus]|uniref:Uncharacterized protein n=1 Tax=Membranihabitans marinus TaxID=1227546 RepID=A0A953HSV8_9BACT|nr:hypothetical protein [Membranihabitans marinus]MBY5957785.1 hypothetical protein [Membranihabitans marinus]
MSKSKLREFNAFIWGAFCAVTVFNFERIADMEISWTIKIIVFVAILIGWVLYAFYPNSKYEKVPAVKNSKQGRRNLIIVSIVVFISAIITILLIRNI